MFHSKAITDVRTRRMFSFRRRSFLFRSEHLRASQFLQHDRADKVELVSQKGIGAGGGVLRNLLAVIK